MSLSLKCKDRIAVPEDHGAPYSRAELEANEVSMSTQTSKEWIETLAPPARGSFFSAFCDFPTGII